MIRIVILVCLLVSAFTGPAFSKALFPSKKTLPIPATVPNGDIDEYVAYFQKVFDVVDANYYAKPDRAKLDLFIAKFKSKIYPQLMAEGKSNDYVRWRATWYLIDSLKTTDDKFSQFYPPKPAEKFQHEALGQRVDLGIEGKKITEGYLVTRLEPRADPYEKGLREDDVLRAINGRSVLKLDEATISKELSPLINTKVKLAFTSAVDKADRIIEVVSKEYFKQTVFMHPVAVPGIFCLEIPKFNRTTGEDLYRFLQLIQGQNPKGLVLDLRGNPGGPPLAAREISSFFLKGGESFAYFQRRGQEKSELDVPEIDERFKYTGPIIVLVNEESGSAAELFSGIMQFRNRALVLGTTTAGQVLLKSMFPIDDGAMVALVTSLGYYPDGKSFGFVGFIPDKIITDAPKDGLINLAATMIILSQEKNF